MADFKALATKLVTSTFGQYQKPLTICTVYGTAETGTAIDITNNFVVDGNPSCEPFTERFENLLAGWTMTFDVLVPNEMTIC